MNKADYIEKGTNLFRGEEAPVETKEYRFGNTIIKVDERSVLKAEDVDEIIKRIGKINDQRPLKAKGASA